MQYEYKMLIGREWVTAGKTVDVINPYNNALLGRLPQATAEDVDRAIATAHAHRGVMADMPAHERAAILEKTAALLERDKERMIESIILESGKTRKWATVETVRGMENLKFAAEAAKALHGETVPLDASRGSEGRLGFWMRVPVGVVAAIPPFNFPLNLVIHKVAPAIAAGNTIVLKPASNTPGPSQILVELLLEAGLPAEALQLLYGSGSAVGEAMVKDPRVAKVTFTGSPPVGKRITQVAGLKKLTLELGSNSGTIIDESADLDKAVARCVMGSFAFSGQVCISVQRIFVHESILQSFTEKFVTETKKQSIGDPLEAATDIGPMISEHEAVRVESWIREAVQQGARLLTGGARRGSILEPTVLTDVTPEMQVMCHEVFGPVVSIVPFKTFDQAIDMVNDSVFGLQAGVFTQNFSHIMKAMKRIETGGVMINDVPTYRVDHMPYGGVKDSGLGREGARFATEEMTHIRMIMLNS
ncbi:MAG TPA: aldehyde dehydrogenase family protein [Caldithrix abyssi]|uniref:Aldehyde dehydrogenase family protein n=1 Tax=Caldithrix abyssi TaxID=187145 RepID=A0A7V1LML2_CALAY|nr:aldehyde dehydrogenase family protein [Caldithrix abyssi]